MGEANPTASATNITVINTTHSQVDAPAIATAALGSLDTAITDVNSSRATFGISANRLGFATKKFSSVLQNTAAARSCISDADYAAKTTGVARIQIIQRASIAMLAQVSVSKTAVLSLVK